MNIAPDFMAANVRTPSRAVACSTGAVRFPPRCRVFAARTVALVLSVFFLLPTLPARADRGVAVGPYWQENLEGNLTALAVGDLDSDKWFEIVARHQNARLVQAD